MSSIPIITPANPAAPLPVTGTTAGVLANASAISQDIENFLPIFNNASSAVKTAQANAQAAGLDPFHTGLAVFIAADQAITPYVPYGPVQAFGGIGALAAAFLGLIPNKPTASAMAVGSAVSAAMNTVQTTSSAAPVAVSAPAAATAPVAASTTVAAPASSPTIQQLERQLAAQSAEISQLESELTNQAPAAPASAVAHAVTPTPTAPADPRLASNPATTKLSGGGFGGFLRGIGHEAAHPVETLQTAEVAANAPKK